MKKKSFAVLLVLIIVYIMIPVSALGEGEHNNISDDIIMEAQVGFSGYFRLEQWTPITVEIENKGEDIEGTLEVAVNQGSDQAIIFSRPAVIPHNSKKRFVLYVQVNSIQKEMNINLVQERNLIKTYEVKGLIPLTWEKYLLGVVTEDKAGMSYWWNTLSSDKIFANHETVHLEVQNIPERKEVLDNFAVLVFNNVDTSLLTNEQKTTLSSWIEDGGILIAGTGTNGNKILSGLNPDIVSLQSGDVVSDNSTEELSKIAEVNLSDNAVLKVMDIKSDAGEIIVQNENHGLVWKHQIGAGYVFISAFDLGLEPIVGWAGNKVFWGKLLPMHLNADTVTKLEKPEMEKDTYSITNMYYQIREALASISAMEMPSFSGLLILLLIYLVVVGPVNYMILRKLDKREWAWVTIPLLVILFSVGIYAMGYTKKGNEVIVNTISAVRLQSKSSSASVDTYVGVFIPKKGDYTISVNKDVLITAFNDDYMEYRTTVQDGDGFDNKYIQARVNQGNPASMEIFDANVWTLKTLTMSSINPDFGKLESELYYHDGRIEGQVTNNTSYPLNDLVIYTQYGYQKIGNIASGETKQVDFMIPLESSNRSSNNLYRMVDEIYPYINRTGGLSSSLNDEERERQVKRSILEGFLVRPMEIKLGTNSDGSFIKAFAFSDVNFGEKVEVNEEEPGQSYYKTLVMADLDVIYEKDGLISTPPGYIRGTINTELSSDNVDILPGGLGLYLDREQAVFTFSMNPYKEAEIYKLEIKVNVFHGTPLLYIYDSEAEEFIDVGEGLEINQIQGIISVNPEVLEKYVDDEDNIHIKIEADRNSPVNIEFPYLIIEGRTH